MNTIYATATALNGFIADENNSLEWLFQFGEPDDTFAKFVASVGAIAMGSTTYQWLLDHHVFSPKGENPWPYKVPAYVFTTRNLRKIEGEDITFVKGDVKPVHEKMKELAKGKPIWIVGGGELAAKFYDQNLLDEIHIHLASVTLSGGAPLFPRKMKKPMKVIGVREMQPGLIEIKYQISK
jgi:dihydrofolate reductase